MKIDSVSVGNVQKNAAGQAPRNVSGNQNTTSNTKVGEKHPARAVAPVEAKPAQALNPRLATYARNIDSRLKVAIENSVNDPRQHAALQAAQASFHSMVMRLDDAFLTEGKPKLDMSPGTAMNRVMEHFMGAVQTVLTHGQVDVKG